MRTLDDYISGSHPGYVTLALDGIQRTLDLFIEKRIKIETNAGGLNPKGMEEETLALVGDESPAKQPTTCFHLLGPR